MKVLRSLLFAPANHPRRSEKAFQVGADGVILDLEDAVALSEKAAARQAAGARLRSRPPGIYTVVRVNGLDTEHVLADLEAVVAVGVSAIMLPKVEAATDVRIADWLITQHERRQGLAAGSVELHAVVETARGLLAMEEIAAASPRLRRIAFGVADFTLDTGMEWSAGNRFLEWAGALVVTVSRASGLEPPLDTVHRDLADAEGFRRAASAARSLGFQGKVCLHPDQVAIANEVFTPSEAEVAEAWAIHAAFTEAEQIGQASIQLNGRFIDYPIARRARQVLEAAREAGVLPAGYKPPM
jgi:citrate lyase subunit beta/citryl-CoA lyase